MTSGRQSYAEIPELLPQRIQQLNQNYYKNTLNQNEQTLSTLSTRSTLQTASQTQPKQQALSSQGKHQVNQANQNVSSSGTSSEFEQFWSDLDTQVNNIQLQTVKIQKCKLIDSSIDNETKVKQSLYVDKQNKNQKRSMHHKGKKGSTYQSMYEREQFMQKWQPSTMIASNPSSPVTYSLIEKPVSQSTIHNKSDKDAQDTSVSFSQIQNSDDKLETKKDQNKTRKLKRKMHDPFAFQNLPPIAHTLENLFLKEDMNKHGNPLIDKVEDNTDDNQESSATTMPSSLEPSQRSMSSKSASEPENDDMVAATLDANNPTTETVDQQNTSVNDILNLLLGKNQTQKESEANQVTGKQSPEPQDDSEQTTSLQKTYFEKSQYFVAPKSNEIPSLF